MKSVALVPSPDGHGYRAELSETQEPSPGKGEIAVDMRACGLCGTDLEKMRGEYTASRGVIGHEAVGVVSALGEGARDFREGDRVFPHHHVPDYDCYVCRAGNETMCDRYRGSNLVPGGFSERFVVPEWNLRKGGVLKLPDEMDFGVASLIEPLACCVRAIKKCDVGLGANVLVVGAGPVGMMHSLMLKPIGANVMVSDVSPDRLRFAEKAGAGVVIDARGDVPGTVRSGTGGRGADLAIVASGNSAAIVQALRSVRKGGTVCVFGVPVKGSVLGYDFSDVYNSEQSVTTSYGATEADTKAALRVLASRGEEFARLITHRFPLARFSDAVSAASGGTAMKVVVTP